MRTFGILVLGLIFLPATLRPQSALLRSYQADAATSPILPANGISHFAVRGTTLWAGTGNGVARTTDGGQTWTDFSAVPQFARNGIFSIALKGDTIWVSTGYTKDVQGSSVQTGAGYTYTTDNGTTWAGIPQALDTQADTIVNYGANHIRFLPIIVNEQNVTFSSAVTDSAVWIASWSSGLRKSTNFGAAWERKVLPSKTMDMISPPDSLSGYAIDPRKDNNYLMFSVLALPPSTVWAGSAGGINKSTDGGSSWTKFTAQNQAAPIPGNWVIALRAQKIPGGTRIWATNWPAEDPTEAYAVSATDDGGRTWRTMLRGVKAYDFAFRDSIVYCATDNGIYRSSDAGASWTKSGTVNDPLNGQKFSSMSFFAVAVIGDTLFTGGNEGIARTVDNGSSIFGTSWKVLRSYHPVASRTESYAYPNPFSPKQETVRIHYSTGGSPAQVTIEIFDFGMNRVRTVIKDAQRTGQQDHDEVWDGRNDGGSSVVNGVYFYRLTATGADPSWGKIMVLQ